LPILIDDFYAEIERHPRARKVITGGQAQIERLKVTLLSWMRELLSGVYDAAYVARRWRVGLRHVEIGLDQVYTNVALSRMRAGLSACVQMAWEQDQPRLGAALRALDKLLDLDLAIIEDAYQYEYMARLQASERLATLGQVSGGVAHELRNPLNVVKTSIYYLKNARGSDPAKQQEHLNRIERNVEAADRVIRALSSFARMRPPELQSVDLAALVQRVLEENPPPGAIRAEIHLPGDLPAAECDGEQMGIVLANLIRNAHDAMPSGGQLQIHGRVSGDFVEIDVMDNGVGIDPEELPRIMEPLHTTKPRGLGLGLAIARSIVEKNKGTIRAVSEPGRGSVFTLRLVASQSRSRT